MTVQPSRFTKPLDPVEGDLPRYSDGYRLLELVDKHYRKITLDQWQKDLIVRALETDKDGNLRFRRFLFSIARQNGKSEICAVFALYALIQHKSRGSVIGIATNDKSAKIVYDRVLQAVRADKRLNKMFKTTGTRGMRNINTGATYNTMAARSNALQGHTISALGIIDEVHIVPEQLWDDMVTSASAHDNALIIGLTTAGDAESALLKRLYEVARVELDNPDTAWGFSFFEGIEGAPIDDPESLLAANPIVACGRKSLETLLDEMKGAPDNHNKRYRHNLFVEAVEEPAIELKDWQAVTGNGVTERTNLTFSIDVTATWSWASVTVARKRDDGVVETQLIASFNNPELEELKTIVKHLKKTYPYSQFIVDSKNLKDLYWHMREKGFTVYNLDQGGYLRMAAMFLSLIGTKKVSHNNDALLTSQIPYVKIKNYADQFALAKGIKDMDAVKATGMAVYIANTKKNRTSQLF